MAEIKDISTKEAYDNLIEIMQSFHFKGYSKKDLTKIINNTLIYNVVIDEVIDQALFLTDRYKQFNDGD